MPTMMPRMRRWETLIMPLFLVVTACTGDGTGDPSVRADASHGSGGPRVAGWQDQLTDGEDMLDVATTVAPISSLARSVGGNRIRLRGIVPDATNSHTFEPLASDAQTLAKADLIVVNGLHLEEPTLDLAEASKKADTEIKLLGDATVTEDEWLFDFSFPESEEDPNPHLWMNVLYARDYAELMRDWFSEADPDNATYYSSNFDALAVRLDDLDQRIREGVQTVPEQNRKLLTYHDSWAYWAREYDFDVIGAVQASDFSDPSPHEVARLIDQIKEEKVPAVFGSEVFPSPVLDQIARESGAKLVDALRDDEPPGEQGAPEHTYLGMLQKDMTIMMEALGGSAEAFADMPVADSFPP